jgi:hypothetical protein
MSSRSLDPLLNVLSTLTRAELDDAKFGETVLVKRIFPDDRFDLAPTLANGEDDPAIARNLAARDEEITGSVVLLQEPDVRGHVRVDFREVGLVDEFDDEHGDAVGNRDPSSVRGCNLRGYTSGLLLLLKTFQRLGYFVRYIDIPAAIISHIAEPWSSIYRLHQHEYKRLRGF